MPLAERRRQLLDAALEIVTREDYTAVSISAVARETGVTRTVVYNAFEDLDELLVALIDRHEERTLPHLLAALPTDADLGDPPTYILTAVRRLAEAVADDPAAWRPLVLPPEGTPQAVRERIEQNRELIRRRIEILLEAFARQTEGPGIDAELTSHALLASAEHFARMLAAQPPACDPQRLTAAAHSLVAATLRIDR